MKEIEYSDFEKMIEEEYIKWIERFLRCKNPCEGTLKIKGIEMTCLKCKNIYKFIPNNRSLKDS